MDVFAESQARKCLQIEASSPWHRQTIPCGLPKTSWSFYLADCLREADQCLSLAQSPCQSCAGLNQQESKAQNQAGNRWMCRHRWDTAVQKLCICRKSATATFSMQHSLPIGPRPRIGGGKADQQGQRRHPLGPSIPHSSPRCHPTPLVPQPTLMPSSRTVLQLPPSP